MAQSWEITEHAEAPVPVPAKGPRIAVQIGNDEHGMVALCPDGTMWRRSHTKGTWVRIEDIPQPPLSRADMRAKILQEEKDVEAAKKQAATDATEAQDPKMAIGPELDRLAETYKVAPRAAGEPDAAMRPRVIEAADKAKAAADIASKKAQDEADALAKKAADEAAVKPKEPDHASAV